MSSMQDGEPVKDIACVKAAISLARDTGNAEFLRLAHNEPQHPKDPVIVNGMRAIHTILDVYGDVIELSQAEDAVKALKVFWGDDVSLQLDPTVIRVLTNSSCLTKTKIPLAYARAFILDFSQRAKNVEIDDEVHGWYEIAETIDAAFNSAQAVLGKPAED